jgi:LPPG:FO 2-phospho-L-lactate transferase
MKPIVALAGGVGAARFLDGLVRLIPPERLVVIVNTADDAEIHGLHISPDLDTITYTLAGLAHSERGWGLDGDTFYCLDSLAELGGETWFLLGDRDLATHLYRTSRLRAGTPLTRITREIAHSLGLRATILPMSNDAVRTRILTRSGELDFQTYFVRRRCRDTVLGLRLEGSGKAEPAPGILDAIDNASAVIVCPSNPLISIGPILAVEGIRDALCSTAARVAAVSPIVGGRALKGPAARMMRSLGMRSSAVQVAQLYKDFVDVFILDRADRREAPAIAALGIEPVVTATIMRDLRAKKALAAAVLAALKTR